MSRKEAINGAGFDFDVANALANRLGLELTPLWFDSEQEEESDPTKEKYAMLAYGLCDLVPGFALYESALSVSDGERSPLPRWDGRPSHIGQSVHITLQPVAATHPYAHVQFAIVVAGYVTKLEYATLKALEGLVVGVQQGTLPGVLTLRQGSQSMVAKAVTVNPGPDFLQRMDRGEFEAALVATTEYDLYKMKFPKTAIKMTNYRHPISFNLAFAGLQKNKTLVERASAHIQGLLGDGTIAHLARSNRTHISQPVVPHIRPRLTMADLLQSD